MKQPTLILIALAAGAVVSAAGTVSETRRFLNPGSEQLIFDGNISLPSEGIWQLDSQDEQDIHLYMTAPAAVATSLSGTRVAKARRAENITESITVSIPKNNPIRKYSLISPPPNASSPIQVSEPVLLKTLHMNNIRAGNKFPTCHGP